MRRKERQIIECSCGCKRTLMSVDKFGKDRKFINGHNKGNYQDGTAYNSYGYKMILIPDHPFAQIDGYVFEHRLVWEKHNNAILLPWADCHHKNGIRDDNRIENLEAMMHWQHMSHHTKKRTEIKYYNRWLHQWVKR